MADEKDSCRGKTLNGQRVDILDSTQNPGQSKPRGHEETLQDMTDDENTLSPASKKLLEKCTVSAPPKHVTQQAKDIISVISRPPHAEPDIAGFNFAKPIHPKTNFSCRSGMTNPSEIPQMTSRGQDKGVVEQRLNDDTPTGGETIADFSQKTSTSTPGDPSPPKLPNISTLERIGTVEHQSRVRSGDSHDSCRDQRSSDNCLAENAGESPLRTGQRNQERNGTHGPLDVLNSATQPSKVMKRRIGSKGKSPGLPHQNGPQIQGSSSQPSEEDLFYLLIHKLRQREDSEAASAALREQMESRIHEMVRVNEDLQSQLEQAHRRFQNQEVEIGSHRGLIDRWKVKFGKLRAFITGVGNDYECLRKEGQAIKSAQAILAGERQVITESLKSLYEGTSRVEQQWSKHQTEFTEMCHDVSALRKSLSIAHEKVADGKTLLLEEKRRVAILENFIKDHSTRQQKQATLIQQRQVETTNKLDLFFDHVQKCWLDSRSILESEVQQGLGECLNLVRLLSDRDFIKPADLHAVHDTIRAISGR
jgi:hypothetical protein